MPATCQSASLPSLSLCGVLPTSAASREAGSLEWGAFLPPSEGTHRPAPPRPAWVDPVDSTEEESDDTSPPLFLTDFPGQWALAQPQQQSSVMVFRQVAPQPSLPVLLTAALRPGDDEAVDERLHIVNLSASRGLVVRVREGEGGCVTVPPESSWVYQKTHHRQDAIALLSSCAARQRQAGSFHSQL